MGCGNCCVFGRYEGLYYIDNDDFHVFRRADAASDDCPEPRLMRDLDYEELTDGTWLYDDLATELEEEDILECFTANFLQMFPSFKRVRPESYAGLQSRHYQAYLKGIEKCLLDRLPSIGTYKSAWTSGRLTRAERSA